MLKCPRCGSDRLRKKGIRNNKQRYKCVSCGKWFNIAAVGVEKQKYLSDEEIKYKLIDLLKRNSYSIEELCDIVDRPPKVIKNCIKSIKNEKYNLQIRDNKVELPKEIPIGSKKYLDYSNWNNNKLLFGFVADTHLCSKYERLDALNLIYDIYEEEGINLVYHGGNWIDGESQFNKYEIHTHGITDQVEYFIKNYPRRKLLKTNIISGDDHEGWYAQRERINIGEYLQLKAEESGRDDLINLGYLEADIELKGVSGNSWMRIMHGGGGTAYALSYTPQRIIESLQGGEKPRILMLGHYHKLDYCFPREVHVIQMGCFQDQTTWMRKKKIQAHVGGGIIELNQAYDGTINRVKVEFITFFDKGFYKGKKKYWR